jgi:zinc transport system ATP-binding protein
MIYNSMKSHTSIQSEPLLSLTDVYFVVGNKSILENIQFSLKTGQILTLIGPNGAGKTTLVKLALGLLTPTEGTIVRKNGLRIGYMPQKLHIDASIPLNVEDFLQLSPAATTNEVSNVLKQVAATDLKDSRLQALSGGELQRVLLARALLHKPELLVLDEPTQGVDLSGQAELYNLISKLRDELGCAVLMISHDLHLVMSATDEVICLNQHVCCHGHPETVSNDPSYRELFGKRGVDAVAVYTHRHDHHHNLTGEVICDHDSESHSVHEHAQHTQDKQA